ncbi:NCS2 family permease [Verrucomicrobia bacterium]|nr:NCS2 family permease [Verrucomicrobiota bacterium]MDA7866823.1 NCS2 family permease [Verrucomicrobiota bacterium]MDB4746324.1 NCS2 family permease [Verrucomicrobiota bacterium]
MKRFLDSFFKLTENGTNLRKECLAGLTSFAAMAYILAVHPSILEAAGMNRAALVTVTALSAAVGCFLMAGLANYPIAMAPGMGMNAFFALTVCVGMGVPWQGALGIVFWNGVIFLFLSVSGLREKVIESVPEGLKLGVQAGIGFFIAFIGLRNAGIVVDHPATLVGLGNMKTAASWLALGGIGLTGVFLARRVPGGVLISIGVVSVLGCFVSAGEGVVTALPSKWVSMPASPVGTSFALDLSYPFLNWRTAWPLVFAFLFVDLFDSMGTLMGVSRSAGLLDSNGRLPKMNRALLADAGATISGALLGTSPVTSYIESAAGVKAGGRTGLTSIVVGLCFIGALFFTPIILALPALATGAALVVIGLTMVEGMRHLAYDDACQFLPAILTMLAMPLVFSISDGIGLGFLTYVSLMLGTGRGRSVKPLTYVVAGLFGLRYLFL